MLEKVLKSFSCPIFLISHFMLNFINNTTEGQTFVDVHNLHNLNIHQSFEFSLSFHLLRQYRSLCLIFAEHVHSIKYFHQKVVNSRFVNPFSNYRSTFQPSSYFAGLFNILSTVVKICWLSVYQKEAREFFKAEHPNYIRIVLWYLISQKIGVDAVEHHNQRFIEQIVQK